MKYRDDGEKWKQAINDELNSLLVNNTWTLVEKPIHKNIVYFVSGFLLLKMMSLETH